MTGHLSRYFQLRAFTEFLFKKALVHRPPVCSTHSPGQEIARAGARPLRHSSHGHGPHVLQLTGRGAMHCQRLHVCFVAQTTSSSTRSGTYFIACCARSSRTQPPACSLSPTGRANRGVPWFCACAPGGYTYRRPSSASFLALATRPTPSLTAPPASSLWR